MRRSLILFSISLRLRGFPVGMEGMPARLVNPELFQNQKPFLIIFCLFNYYFTNPNFSISCLGPQWVPVSYLCTKASCFGISDTVEYQLSMMIYSVGEMFTFFTIDLVPDNVTICGFMRSIIFQVLPRCRCRE